MQPGDRVAHLGGNSPAFLELLFATGRLGAVFVPLNPRLSPAEVAYMVGDCGARVLVHDAAAEGLVPRDLGLAVVPLDGGPYDDLLAGGDGGPVDVARSTTPA